MMSSVAVSEAFKLEMQLFEISFSGFADQRIRWLDTLGPLGPAAIVNFALLGVTKLGYFERRIYDASRHSGATGRDDRLEWVDSLAFKDLPELICWKESLGLGIKERVDRYIYGARHVARGQSRPRLGSRAVEAACRPRIKDLDSLGPLLVVVHRNIANLLKVGNLIRRDLWDGVRAALDVIQVSTLDG